MMLFSPWPRNRKRPAPAPAPRSAGIRPRLEGLENRCVPSTLTVTSIQDSGAGSLRAEIAAAQGGDSIVFSATLPGTTTTSGHGKKATTTTTPPTITLTGG